MAVETVEVTLGRTIFAKGRFVRSLKLRAPTQAEVDQACGLAEDAGERGLLLIALVTGVDPRALTKLSEPDLLRLETEYERVAGT